ncbi:MAG: hypothetical protein MUC42_04770 [Bryobacter sp.]|nr:hypothetical protein [Bryobacter sp.]
MRTLFVFLVGAVWADAQVGTVELTATTVQQFENIARAREKEINRRLSGESFLWLAEKPERLQAARGQQVVIEAVNGQGVTHAHEAMVHDWIGGTFLPGVKLDQAMAFLADYDNHKRYFGPEVEDSKLLGKEGGKLRAYLRLRKKKFLTVILNTEYEVAQGRAGTNRGWTSSYSTKIAEVKDAGSAKEKELPLGKDHGFLWRLYSWWRFEERDGGTYVEFEALSLSRDVPALLSRIITPIVRELPRDSVEMTLVNFRKGLTQAR